MASNFSVFIDADSCPSMVRESVSRYTQKYNIPLIFAANREISLKNKGENFSMVVVSQTEGAADNYIAEKAQENDLVITRDIPLAARLVEKKICVINDRGLAFNEENIREKLSERNFNLNLSMIGFQKERKSNYGDKEFKKFSDSFDRIMQQKIAVMLYFEKKAAENDQQHKNQN